MTPHAPISRRDFITATAAGAASAALAACAPAQNATAGDAGGTPLPDASAQLYIGTYTDAGRTDGVHLLRLDAATGALARQDTFDVGPNPSFLALHPNGRALYAVNEVTEVDYRMTAIGGSGSGVAHVPDTGQVAAFAIATSGSLARLGDPQLTYGGAPCYVSLDPGGRVAMVANYVGGNLAVFGIAAGDALGIATQVEEHQGRGPDAERQEKAHAHSVLPDPSGRWALSADLGADRVYVYALDAANPSAALRRASELAMPPGAGPRHIAFHPTLALAYVANELANTVSALAWDATRGTLALGATVSTLPAGWSGHNQVADIHVAPDGRTLYVSNRGHDSIAVFALDAAGTPAFVDAVSTEGNWPRNFALDASGRWLVVANERSDVVVVLARDAATGRLTSTGQRLAVPKPVCVRFRQGR